METQRFEIREIQDSDIENIYKGLSDPQVIAFYGVSFNTLEETKEQMVWYADLKKNKTGIWWGIYSKATGDFYGAGGYNDVDSKNKKAEIGFWLLPEYWGQGTMTEVMPVLFKYGFNELGLNRIEGFVDSENIKCKKALSKINFQYEGTMREAEYEDGKFLDIDIYAKIKPKYNIIGQDYNQTRKADSYLFNQLLHHLNPNKKDQYLDIGCGTGNYTSEFHKLGYQFIGVDPSDQMLSKAKAKFPEMDWRIGAAAKTNLKNESVDGIVGTLTIHHWPGLKGGFEGLFKVLKTNGKMVIFTSTPKQMDGYWLNHYFPKMLEASKAQMPALNDVKHAIVEAGFKIIKTEEYSVKPDLKDQFLYCGKHDPSLYFKPEIRNGISSFRSLSNAEEVAVGLEQLQADIESGEINKIKKQYENDLGDYLYVIAQKMNDD